MLFAWNFVSAQQSGKYYLVIKQLKGKRQSGKIAGIEPSGIILSQKKSRDSSTLVTIPFSEISKLKLYHSRGAGAFGAVTSIAVIGNIAYAFSFSNAWVAVAVGSGGSLAIVGLAAILYQVAHPPLLKLKAGQDKLDYETLSETLKVYIERAPAKSK